MLWSLSEPGPIQAWISPHKKAFPIWGDFGCHPSLVTKDRTGPFSLFHPLLPSPLCLAHTHTMQFHWGKGKSNTLPNLNWGWLHVWVCVPLQNRQKARYLCACLCTVRPGRQECVCLAGVDSYKIHPTSTLQFGKTSAWVISHSQTNTQYQHTRTHTHLHSWEQLLCGLILEGVFTPFTQHTSVDVHRQTHRTEENFSWELFPPMEPVEAVK